MIRHSWAVQVLLLGFVLILPPHYFSHTTNNLGSQLISNLSDCLRDGNTNYVVADNFYGLINASKHIIAWLNETHSSNFSSCFSASVRVKQLLRQANDDVSSLSSCLSSVTNGNNPPSSLTTSDISHFNSCVSLMTVEIQQLLFQATNDISYTNSCLSSAAVKGWPPYYDISGLRSCLSSMTDKIQQLSSQANYGSSSLSSCGSSVGDDNQRLLFQAMDGDSCIIFLQQNTSRYQLLWKAWPQVNTSGNLLYIPKDLTQKNVTLYVLSGNNCSTSDVNCIKENVTTGPLCAGKQTYDKSVCAVSVFNDKYILTMSNSPHCINCDNPIKSPDESLPLNQSLTDALGYTSGSVAASGAVHLVAGLGSLISQMNGTSAALSVGEGVKGVLVRQTNTKAMNHELFAYQSSNSNISLVDDAETLSTFSRSVAVSKEAFQKALLLNISMPFSAVVRFLNMTQDEKNSTLLQNEVIAIEMGAEIKNLTDTINITFKNIDYKGIPQCHSWNGEGGKPNWTDEGCNTTIDAHGGIVCQCSHLTFFAILLSPINETISSTDLKYLTIISQAGCGLSMFFLGVALFMHFLLRKKRASQSMVILIHLVLAMFLLNFTFLINNTVANMKSSVGCQIMALFMHFSMLATFSWFAAQAFHLCLQFYTGGQIMIKRYILKVSATTWVVPAVIVIILASLGKYSLETIYTDDPANNVAMCWINDNSVHYIVNIGYYALVFIFTFTTVIITLSWLSHLKKSKLAEAPGKKSGKSTVTILGLCCQLGITWGFAFFAYGPLRIPATYIFTILNSFQGFFLFVYYYHVTKARDIKAAAAAANGNSSTQTSTGIHTLKTGLDTIFNPYQNFESQKPK